MATLLAISGKYYFLVWFFQHFNNVFIPNLSWLSPLMAVQAASEKALAAETSSNLNNSILPTSEKPLWSSIVQPKSNLLKHELSFSVTPDGTQVVDIPDDVIRDASPLWDEFIIGKFLDLAPHIAKVHLIVNKIWKFGNKALRIDAFMVNNATIKFKIKDKSIRERILRRGMWNTTDIPMVVSRWSPISEESQPEFKAVPMWIKLTNVPPEMFSMKGLGFLSSAVGDPKKLHPDTELRGYL